MQLKVNLNACASAADSQHADGRSGATESSPVSFVLSDPNVDDNPIVFCSQAFLDDTGYERDQIVGRNCRFLQVNSMRLALCRCSGVSPDCVAVYCFVS